MKQKGRPKGSGQTVIGVGRKRKRQDTTKGPIMFSKKYPLEKDKSMIIL